MSKAKTSFFCTNCGYESTKWLGKCPSCAQWNTFTEEVVVKESIKPIHPGRSVVAGEKKQNRSIALHEVQAGTIPRINTPDAELNRVLGGGIVPGIKMRAGRINKLHDSFYLLTETNTQTIFQEIRKVQPQLIIVDSIQTLESPYIDSSAGSVSQIRETASELQRFAKESNIPVFLIGHITKDGAIAGPKILEHMVDTVLQFEGDRHYAYRILRTQKNRFGSTSEIGIYEMTVDGMRAVTNPSEILITQREEQLSGSAIAATIEGMRPLLVEVQALVAQSVYGTPQRTTSGYDLRRLQLLLAVLEKRGGFQFGVKDVFLNIAGGMRIEDPSIDLAVVVALLSSYNDVPVPHNICFAGEVGLNGEVRSVNRIEQRIAEAEKLGFDKIFISKYSSKNPAKLATGIAVEACGRVDEVYQKLF
jgi:DNA repair protein RadA/Sms